jgi:hypothetical protein
MGDGSSLVLCLVVGFDVCGVELLGSTNRELVTFIVCTVTATIICKVKFHISNY